MLSFLAEHGEAYYPNQSVNGLLNRLMGIAEPEQYKQPRVPALARSRRSIAWVYWPHLDQLARDPAAALLRRNRDNDPDRLSTSASWR